MNSVVIVTRCYHSHNVSIGLLLPSGSLCHPPRPSAFDNFLLDLHNSSYHTQPHYMAGAGGGGRKEQWVSQAKQLLCMYFTFAVSRPVARFFFTGRCHPTSRRTKRGRRCKPLCGREGWGGFDCPSLHFVRFEGGMIKKQVAKSETWIFRKVFDLQN